MPAVRGGAHHARKPVGSWIGPGSWLVGYWLLVLAGSWQGPLPSAGGVLNGWVPNVAWIRASQTRPPGGDQPALARSDSVARIIYRLSRVNVIMAPTHPWPSVRSLARPLPLPPRLFRLVSVPGHVPGVGSKEVRLA